MTGVRTLEEVVNDARVERLSSASLRRVIEPVKELVAEEYLRKKHVGQTSHSQGGQVTVAFDQKAMHAAVSAKLSNWTFVAPLL